MTSCLFSVCDVEVLKIISRLISLTFLLCRIYSKTPQILAGIGMHWLWAYKTGNISETVEDRAKVTINDLYTVGHGLSIAA